MNNNILDLDLNEDGQPYIELISPSKFTALFLLSFGFYAIWWMYKSWQLFKARERAQYHSVLRSLLAIFFLIALFERIQNFAKSEGYTKHFSEVGLFVLYLLLNFTSNFLSNAPGTEFIGLISLLGFIAFLQPIQAYNYAILHSNDYKGEVVNAFNSRQLIILVMGLLFWSIITVALLFPA